MLYTPIPPIDSDRTQSPFQHVTAAPADPGDRAAGLGNTGSRVGQ